MLIFFFLFGLWWVGGYHPQSNAIQFINQFHPNHLPYFNQFHPNQPLDTPT